MRKSGAAVLFVIFAGQVARADDMPLRPEIGGGTTFVQLSAERSESDAAHTWVDIVHQNDGLLDDLTPQITPVKVPHRGRMYRLRTGPMSAANAASICAQLKTKGFACLIVP